MSHKVNIGCGEQYAEGWVNVDHQSMPHRKDLVLDVRNPLPWSRQAGQERGELIDFCYLGHVLEHLRIEEVIVFLRRLRAAMSPSGVVMVVGPDCVRAEGLAVTQTLEVPLEQIRHGAGRWQGDVHRWECTEWGVYRLLESTGWVDIARVGIKNVPALWPVAFRGPRWQCAVSARPGEGPFHDFDS